MNKVSIIGAGEVGASCATCLAERDFVNEITIIDIKPGLAEGKALDLRQSAALKRFDTIDMVPGGTILNIEKGQWHSLKCMEPNTILFEAKDGAYEPLKDDDILQCLQ